MDPIITLILAGAFGGSLGLFVYASNELVRETVSEVGVDRNVETITSNKFFRYIMPFIQIASFYISRIPSEEEDEALGYADQSLRNMSAKRRLARQMGKIRKRLRKKLIQAGKAEVFSPDDMIGTCIVSAFLWAGIGWYFHFMDVLPDWGIYVAFLFGSLFPLLSLESFVKQRQKQLIRGLPYSIDLLSLSMEAGLDFTTALQRIVDRQRGKPIAEEMGEMLRQVKIGRTRRDALRDLAMRVDLDDITSFANSLIQADELGTPIGQVLQVQAEMMRFKRFQRAEELAGKAPVKILFPLVVFIMPTVFMVLFGPMLLSASGLSD